MSAGNRGFLAFDPDIAAVAGDTGAGSGGGGLIGSGVYYSRPTALTGGLSDVSDQFSFTGGIAGTLVAQVSNASDNEVRDGADQWDDDGTVDVPAISTVGTNRVVDTDTLDFSAALSGSDLTARVATTAALPTVVAAGSGVGKTLTASDLGILTIDGVATVLNDLILVKNQASAIDNGLYKVTTAGTVGVAFVLTRSTSMDATAEAVPGTAINVTAGTVNTGTHWVLGGTAQNFVVRMRRVTEGRVRYKFTRTSGYGKIKARRVVKAS